MTAPEVPAARPARSEAVLRTRKKKHAAYLTSGEIQTIGRELALRFKGIYASEATGILDAARDFILRSSTVGDPSKLPEKESAVVERVLSRIMPIIGPSLSPVTRPTTAEVAMTTRFAFRHDAPVVRLLTLACGAATVDDARSKCLRRFGHGRTPSRSAVARYRRWILAYAERQTER